MKVHKRKKNSRIRGSKTVGWGFRQKHKGHGNKGGVGKAGSGKKADHKKQIMIESDPKKKYFGRAGATSRSTKRKKTNQINLYDIRANKYTKEGCKIALPKHKILGTGEGMKAEILAKEATKTAIKKMEAAGGTIKLPTKKEIVDKKEKTEKKETKKIEEKNTE